MHHTDLIENGTFNREAAELSDLTEGENFTMANFTYNNSAVVSQMFTHLQNTSFPGITVSNCIRYGIYTYTLFLQTSTFFFREMKSDLMTRVQGWSIKSKSFSSNIDVCFA